MNDHLNDFTASWTYGNRGELLEVRNARTVSSSPSMTSNNLEVVSQYAYTYDAAGRRISCAHSGAAFDTPDTNSYRYNARSELTNATAAVDAAYRYGYDFDDIGNRKMSAERGTNSVYTANSLNQYASITNISTFQHSNIPTFQPTFDADGNQTLVKTATGVWSVTYNGENRPVRWELVSPNSNTPNSNTQTLLQMSFDRMGRRVTKNDQRFFYDGYLQICNFHSTTTTSNYNYFIWDPTEPVATRPLAWTTPTTNHESPITNFYTHDGNKNVSEVVAADTDVAAHYEYAPFGALTVSRGESDADNPWRFSSEYAEDDTATVYYNYRHYEPVTGRWLRRDFSVREYEPNLFAFINNLVTGWDVLGERYGNPVTDQGGNPIGPSSPFDPGGAYDYDLDESGECCCGGKIIPCDNRFKWKGTITVISISYWLAVEMLLLDIESNVVCSRCAKYRLRLTKILGGISAGFPFSLTGSEIEFGHYPPESFNGSITILAAGAAAMGGVEASYVRIGRAESLGISPVGGGELGVSLTSSLGDANPDVVKIPCGELK